MESITETLQLLERSGRHLEFIPCKQTRAMLEAVVVDLLFGTDPRETLGLSGADARDARRARRNFFLKRALRQLPPGTVGGRCKELQKEISTFLAILWPRWREMSIPPEGTSELRACLFHARRAGKFPDSHRQFVNIAKSEICQVLISHDALETEGAHGFQERLVK
jgi:hypothetical protein